jgi:hypothetical protein
MSPQLLVKDVPRVMSCRQTIPCGLDKDEMFTVRVYFVKDKETGEVGTEMEIKVHKSASMCRLCLMLEELMELPHNSFYVYTSLAKLMNCGAPKPRVSDNDFFHSLLKFSLARETNEKFIYSQFRGNEKFIC